MGSSFQHFYETDYDLYAEFDGDDWCRSRRRLRPAATRTYPSRSRRESRLR